MKSSHRLQIHIRHGHVRLYTMNGANWFDRYPFIGATPRTEPLGILTDRKRKEGFQALPKARLAAKASIAARVDGP
jgi:ATP-dependent DNA ligase